jgi:flagellar motor switch protein FliG
MKSVFDMSGSERAAALLVALGPELAADIMKHLDDESIERISREIARIDGMTVTDREELIGEFMIELKKEKGRVEGGEQRARDLLVQAFGPERAREVIGKLSDLDPERHFSKLEEVEPELLARLLKEEQPGAIAVAMSQMSPRVSAAIMKELPRELSGEVALKIARMQSITPETAARVGRALLARYERYLETEGRSERAEGIPSLVNILNHMSGSEEQKLMQSLDSSAPDLSEKIRDHIFTFENVVNLNNSEMRILIDEINDDNCIALALKGAGDEIRFRFLRNMSRNRASDILDEMEAMGKVPLSDVLEQRYFIVSIMRQLSDNGQISIIRDHEQFVE